MTYGADDVFFHSYELRNQPGVVATLAFIRPASRRSEGDAAPVLDSIVIAASSYLDEIWGTAKTAPDGYTPITMEY